jgi:hypothetical protein
MDARAAWKEVTGNERPLVPGMMIAMPHVEPAPLV